MPRISVILPVYNEEKYLAQCLESLLQQTLYDIEIICVDDESTDNSLKILRNYEKIDARVKVITQKNQYAGAARNNGMKHAAGKYLLFLDSDDFFELDMLEKLYQRAEKDQLDVTLCHYYNYNDRSGERIETNFTKQDSFFPQGRMFFSGTDIKNAGIFQSMAGWAWDKLFRADFVREMGYKFPDFRSSEDGFFTYMLVTRARRIGALKEHLVWHRIYNESSLSNTRWMNWENGFKMLEMIYDELINCGIYDIYEQSFISWAVSFQVWYLTTLYEKTAFFKSYEYIREHTEQKFKIINYQGEFICSHDLAEYYKMIITLEPEQFLLRLLKDKDDAISRSQNNGIKKGWVFPYESVPRNSRLVIYGAGSVGHSYFEQLKAACYCKELHIVDQNYQKYAAADYPVEDVEAIGCIDFDYIIIAISNYRIRTEVSKMLNEKYNIPALKIV